MMPERTVTRLVRRGREIIKGWYVDDAAFDVADWNALEAADPAFDVADWKALVATDTALEAIDPAFDVADWKSLVATV